MRTAIVPARRKRGRPRPQAERLERRLLCTTSGGLSAFLTATLSDPVPSAVVSTPPQTVTLTFDRPVMTDLIGNDLQLDLVASDGSMTSVVDNGPAYSETFVTDTQLVVTLNQTLAPGHYRAFLAGLTNLMGQDSSMPANPGTDQPAGDFWVEGQGPSVADASPIAAPVGHIVTEAGTLDLGTNPVAVKLYQFTLPDTQPLWRVGVSVDAQRLGSTLDSALTLFDSAGNPIATDDVGRPDAPADPYLFAALHPGTYYVGVSGTGNVPEVTGGYSLKGDAGTVAQTQPGGDFLLHVLADPITRPTSLLRYSVNHADPLDSSPTGLTLQFSGALGISQMLATLGKSPELNIVDQAGNAWPITVSGYDEASATISFLFTSRLPQGQYKVIVPDQGGLVDLAGLPPVAQDQTSHELFTFAVGQGQTGGDPHNLGALLPSDTAAGVSRDALLNGGEEATYRVVVTYADRYAFQVEYGGGPLSMTVTDASQRVVMSGGQEQGVTNENLTAVQPGVYFVHLKATGDQPVLAHLTIKAPQLQAESVLENGVGQGSALNLTLIAPTVLTTAVSDPPPLALSETVGSAPSVTPTPALQADSGSSSASGPISVATVSGGGGAVFQAKVPFSAVIPIDWQQFVGRQTGANRVGPVGPGEYAVAHAGGLPQGMGRKGGGGASRGAAHSRGRKAVPVPPGFTRRRGDDSGPVVPPKDGAMVTGAPFPGPTLADAAEVEATWLDRLGQAITQEFSKNDQEEFVAPPESAGASQVAAEVETDDAELAEGRQDEADPGQEPEGVEQASLISPIGAGLIGALVAQYRHQIRRWLAKRQRRSTVVRRASASPTPGRPHALT